MNQVDKGTERTTKVVSKRPHRCAAKKERETKRTMMLCFELKRPTTEFPNTNRIMRMGGGLHFFR